MASFLTEKQFRDWYGEIRPDWRTHLYFPGAGDDGKIPIELYLIQGVRKNVSELWFGHGGTIGSAQYKGAEVPITCFWLVAGSRDKDLLLRAAIAVESFATPKTLRPLVVSYILKKGSGDNERLSVELQEEWLHDLIRCLNRAREISADRILLFHQRYNPGGLGNSGVSSSFLLATLVQEANRED